MFAIYNHYAFNRVAFWVSLSRSLFNDERPVIEGSKISQLLGNKGLQNIKVEELVDEKEVIDDFLECMDESPNSTSLFFQKGYMNFIFTVFIAGSGVKMETQRLKLLFNFNEVGIRLPFTSLKEIQSFKMN